MRRVPSDDAGGTVGPRRSASTSVETPTRSESGYVTLDVSERTAPWSPPRAHAQWFSHRAERRMAQSPRCRPGHRPALSASRSPDLPGAEASAVTLETRAETTIASATHRRASRHRTDCPDARPRGRPVTRAGNKMCFVQSSRGLSDHAGYSTDGQADAIVAGRPPRNAATELRTCCRHQGPSVGVDVLVPRGLSLALGGSTILATAWPHWAVRPSS